MQNSVYSKAPSDTFLKVQMGAGMFVSTFDPSTGTAGDPLFATDGGAKFDAKPNFIDLADGIDNINPNTKELKEIDSWDVTISGTGKTVDVAAVRRNLGAADIDSQDNTKIVPRNYLKDSDFIDFWWIGPVGRKSNGASTDYIAIHLMNALSTDGFSMQTKNADKGSFPFSYMAHYSIYSPDVVPFEVYVKNTPNPTLTSLTVTSIAGTESGDSKITVSGYTLGSGEKYMYKTDASTAPSVSYGDTISTGWTQLTSGSDITPTSGHTKIAVAAVDSSNKAIGYGSATLVIAS